MLVTRTFSLPTETSETLNAIQSEERGRPFSHILRDAVSEYWSNHYEAEKDTGSDAV